MADELNLGMFKTYDVRTRQQNLTPETKERLYNSIALFFRDTLKAPSVVIARDARLYVPEIAEGLAATMRRAGIAVLLNPLPISTCQFYYTCMQHPESAGIMVTASHNPGEYIGLKLMSQGLEPIATGCGPEGGISKIRDIYIKDGKVEGDKKAPLTVINYLDSYIDYSMRLAGVRQGSLSGMKILLEFLNGSAGAEVAMAFQKAGASVEVCHPIPNGFFPLGDPNPIIESSIAPAREKMRNGDYDIGFCFDGDGDRLDFMNSNGDQIVPGLNMAIILPRLMKLFGGRMNHVYADVKAIPVALCQLARTGAKVHIIRNGHSFIKEKLRVNCSKGYLAAEEESAHYYMNFPFDPADPSKGYAAVENTLFYALLSAVAYKEDPEAYRKAEKLQASIFRYREWPLRCEAAPERMPDLMDAVEDLMKKEGALVIKDMDDGSDLDATLMRFNLPESFSEGDSLEGRTWAQVAQRISRSEDAMCRWEIVASSQAECDRLNALVRSVTDTYVEKGWARY